MSNVLVIGDTHAPCMLDGYVTFLKRVYKKYKCNRVVHIGDLVDWASINYHEKSGALDNPDGEYAKAKKQVAELYRAFPKATILTGNHDALPARQIRTAKLPDCIIKSFNDLWNIPEWEVIPRYCHKIIDGVQYQHGDRPPKRALAALHHAKLAFRSVVQGDLHAQCGIETYANEKETEDGGFIFGMQVGTGIDHRALGMEYGRLYVSKPIVACGVVLGGVEPHLQWMHL